MSHALGRVPSDAETVRNRHTVQLFCRQTAIAGCCFRFSGRLLSHRGRSFVLYVGRYSPTDVSPLDGPSLPNIRYGELKYAVVRSHHTDNYSKAVYSPTIKFNYISANVVTRPRLQRPATVLPSRVTIPVLSHIEKKSHAGYPVSIMNFPDRTGSRESPAEFETN
jgi:hypothetical protein